jgi:hypothetical protein
MQNLAVGEWWYDVMSAATEWGRTVSIAPRPSGVAAMLCGLVVSSGNASANLGDCSGRSSLIRGGVLLLNERAGRRRVSGAGVIMVTVPLS